MSNTLKRTIVIEQNGTLVPAGGKTPLDVTDTRTLVLGITASNDSGAVDTSTQIKLAGSLDNVDFTDLPAIDERAYADGYLMPPTVFDVTPFMFVKLTVSNFDSPPAADLVVKAHLIGFDDGYGS